MIAKNISDVYFRNNPTHDDNNLYNAFQDLIDCLSHDFKSDNPSFDDGRFYTACFSRCK